MLDPDFDFLSTFLDEAIEILEGWEKACLNLEVKVTPEGFDELFRRAHNLKGSAKSVGLVDFANLVHKAEDLITQLKSKEIVLTKTILATLLDCQNLLLEWTQNLKKNQTYRPDTKEIEVMLLQKPKPEIAKNEAFGFFDEEPTQIKVQAKEYVGKTDETIRVSIKKLDSIIRLIGELSIQHSIVVSAKDLATLEMPKAHEAIMLSHKVIQDLQSEAMTLRMQPLEGLFQRLDRVAKDVARQQNKSIEIHLKGIDVELDKTVIEKMKDPLVHILRNAVDHGVENTIERITYKKNSVANIFIEGVQTASSVLICIEDDGKGLDKDKILKKAKEKGLISENLNLNDEEIYNLIFLPGFSTAEKVTDVSGRGVGMDVVKKAVDELSGSVKIESQKGKGTKFIIQLPSTLSILDAVVVSLSGSHYAVPIQDIVEVVDLTSNKIESTSSGCHVLNLRGKVFPIEKLNKYLYEKKFDATIKSRPVALITKQHNTMVAFEVDEVIGQQSIVVRQLETQLCHVPGYSGGTILSSGEPSMILCFPAIVKAYLETR